MQVNYCWHTAKKLEKKGLWMQMKNVLTALAALLLLFGLKGAASAQTATPYVNCGEWTTVDPANSGDQQVTCNGDDVALGGGYELGGATSLPLPATVLTIVPQNSFLLNSTSAVGWQVVLQNVNTFPLCSVRPRPAALAKTCPSIQFRVCVSCLTPATNGEASGTSSL
jgi:hypothetical protein